MIATLLGALALLGETGTATAPTAARWSLQVEPAHCTLVRQKSETGSTLSIDTTPGSDNYRLGITGDDMAPSESLKHASLTFFPSQKVTTRLARVARLPDDATVIVMQGLPSSLLDDLSGAATLTIESAGGGKIILPVSGAASAVKAFRKCDADQLVDWGADPAQFTVGGTVPIALVPRDEWISNNEFLKLAGKSKRLAVNDDFRLLVALDGVITECHATADITEKSLEQSACAAVIGRQLFSPAKDSSGNAVRGAATFRITLIRRPS